ncbi:MAG TPA: hypothetical protein VMG99_01730 [Thermoplasmata archaeon]|nr:hypothetical protein [Thermoplasmata archaeon]
MGAAPNSAADAKGQLRLGLGAGLGLAGALVGIVVPVVLLFLSVYDPGGVLSFTSSIVQYTAILVLAGAILLLLSFFVYRRSFAALRRVDPRFVAASVLCLIGSLGFLLILVAAAVVVGDSSSLLSCLHGQPSHALSCLESGAPLGAYTGLIGFWLGWLGGVGLVLGLFSAGSRFHRAGYSAGGALYAVLLLVLVAPFLSLLTPIPGIEYLLLVVPILAIVAPALVLGASRSEPL